MKNASVKKKNRYYISRSGSQKKKKENKKNKTKQNKKTHYKVTMKQENVYQTRRLNAASLFQRFWSKNERKDIPCPSSTELI